MLNEDANRTSRLSGIVRHLHMRSRRQTDPGSRPGSVVVDPAAPAPKITSIQFNANDIIETDEVQLGQISELLSDNHVTWLNVDGLGDAATIKKIGELFGIHRLVLEDIVNVHQRARVEEFDDHLFIVARMVTYVDHLETEQIGIIVGRNFIITFQEHVGDCLDPVRKRLRKAIGKIRSSGADYLAYAILDAVIDGYYPVLDAYSERLDQLEAGLTISHAKDVVVSIHRLRSEFYILRRAIGPHREMVNSLIRDMEARFAPETLVYLRDCYDHTIQILDTVDTSREIASDIRDFHFTQIGIRQNEIMKVLTIVASIFIPLGFVTGLYGMNFDTTTSTYNMPELHWRFGYPMALSIMATIVTGMMYTFWRRGWLNR